MKYKLINTKTKEEHLCDKITIDRFDYYVSDEYANYGHFVTDGNIIEQVIYKDLVTMEYSVKPNGRTPMLQKRCVTLFRKIIACNNPHIDIPKVMDEVEELSEKFIGCKYEDIEDSIDQIGYDSFKRGYNKSQETHPFSEEDMIEFAWWLKENIGQFSCDRTAHFKGEYFKLWKEQQPKIVYYES